MGQKAATWVVDKFHFFLGLWDFLGYACFDQITVAGFWSHFQVNYSRRGRSRPGGFGRGGRTATSLRAQSVAGRELQARTELLARMRLNSLRIMIYFESVGFYLLRRRELYSSHTEKSPAVGKATETRQTKQVYLKELLQDHLPEVLRMAMVLFQDYSVNQCLQRAPWKVLTIVPGRHSTLKIF